MKYHFILNPSAGKGNQITYFQNKIKEVCEREKLDYNIHITEFQGEATEYVKSQLALSCDMHRFYSFGGDGTLCEIVNGAYPNTNVEIGLIPIGTGNDFCRNFTEKENFFDIEKQIAGTSEKVDLIKYNDRFCINMMNIGFDCNVAYNTINVKKMKLIPNKLSYIFAILISLFQKMTSHQKIIIDDELVIDREILLTAIANGCFCGGGFRALPLASLKDSKMDISVVEKMSRLRFIALVGKYKKGTHLETKTGKNFVNYLKASSIQMEFDKPMRVSVDGEIETTTSLTLSIIPNAVSFIIPDGSKMIKQEANCSSEDKIINLVR